MVFTRFIEIGRVVMVNYGDDYGYDNYGDDYGYGGYGNAKVINVDVGRDDYDHGYGGYSHGW